MAFTKITPQDRQGKGNVGQPDTPGLTTSEMQELLDSLPNLAIDKFNNHIDELGETTAAGNIGVVVPGTLDGDAVANIQSVVNALAYLTNLSDLARHSHANKDTLDLITTEYKDTLDTLQLMLSNIGAVTTLITSSSGDDELPTAKAVYDYVDLAQAGSVSSFNGRTGEVVPTSGDYTANQVTYGASTVGAALDGKQNTLTAGDNIQINNGAISATDTTYQSKSAASGGTDVSLVTTGEKYTWNSKQNALTAGDNITIENNVISAANGVTYTAGDNITIDENNEISATDTTYTAGTNVSISSGNVISATDTTYESKTASSGGTEVSLVTTGEKYTWNAKQDAIVAGTNVSIASDGKTISATDTTYESKTAAQSGTDVSLVTTGEKYTWNNKADASDIPGVMTGASTSSDGDVGLVPKPYAADATKVLFGDGTWGAPPSGVTQLSALNDVSVGSQTDGQALVWDSTTSKWKNGTVSGSQVQTDWNQANTSAVDYLKNKPTLGTAAAKDSTNAVTQSSTALVESGAVYSYIDTMITEALTDSY